MKVVITGIGGLLGGRLASWILSHEPEAQIWGIDDWSCGYRGNVPDSTRCWAYDYSLGSGAGFVQQVCQRYKPDILYHFAAYAAEGLSPFVRTYNYRNNLLATAEVINAAISADVRRVVFTSSMAVYGRQSPPFSEDLPYAPIDPYAVAKAAAEQDLRIAGEQHGLDWTIIRPHNVFGCGQDLWTPYRNVLGIWMARTLAGLPIRIYGDGCQVRAFSWIDDALPCLWRAGTDRRAIRQIINLGGTQPVQIREAADTLLRIMDGATVEFHEPRHEVREAWCTWDKSVELLGYEDRTHLADGLAEMWAWAKTAWDAYPERRGRPPMQYEITRGLYQYWQTATLRQAQLAAHGRAA